LIFVNITRLQKDILEVMSIDKDILDIRENKNVITSTFRDRIRKIRDHFNLKAREWFEKLDEEGWILRPIIYKKHDEKQIALLSKAYKRMLIQGIDFEELGSKKNVRLSDAEYTELKNVLKSTAIGRMNEGKGYKETGLFIHEDENRYSINIPACMNRILKFNGNSNKSMADYSNKFFFSLIHEVKPKRTIEQWIEFMMGLNLLLKTKDGFIERISNYELDGKYSVVKKWLEDDCKKEIDSMKKVINGPYLDVLEKNQVPYYKVQLQEAEKIKDSINVDKLSEKDDKNMENFRDVISKIEEFLEICYQVYDSDGWNNIKTYNPSPILELYRILFLDIDTILPRTYVSPSSSASLCLIFTNSPLLAEKLFSRAIFKSLGLPVFPISLPMYLSTTNHPFSLILKYIQIFFPNTL
jgi:hypothetical protein